ERLLERLRVDRDASGHRAHASVREVFAHPVVLRLAFMLGVGIAAGLYAISFWLPQVLKAFSGMGDVAVTMATAVPYVIAAIVMLLVGAHSDRTGERFLHFALCCVAAATGFALSALLHSLSLVLLSLSIAAAGTFGAMGPFWTLPPKFLRGSA